MDKEALKAAFMGHMKTRSEATKEYVAAATKGDKAGLSAAMEKAKTVSAALKDLKKAAKK